MSSAISGTFSLRLRQNLPWIEFGKETLSSRCRVQRLVTLNTARVLDDICLSSDCGKQYGRDGQLRGSHLVVEEDGDYGKVSGGVVPMIGAIWDSRRGS